MRTVLKALFGLLLVALLLWRLDLHAIVSALARYRWPRLLAAFCLLAASWPVAAARWKLFADRFPFLRLLELTLIGQFYAIALPGQLAGEVVKAWRLAKGNVDAERLAATVLLDRIIGTVALLLVASAGLLLSRHRLPLALGWSFATLTVALGCSLLALRIDAAHALARRVVGWLERTRLGRLGTSLHRALDAWHGFSHASARLFVSLLLGLLFQALGIAMFAVLGGNLGIALPLVDWAWLYGAVSLAVLLPVSIGGLGLREGALVGCLAFLGIPAEQAIALSFGVFAITLAGAALGGVLELIEAAQARVETAN